MGEYQYTPLPSDHSEIRLVRLQPGLPGSDIHIEIFHALISSEPVYEALSYAWGCPDRTQILRVQEPAAKPNRKDLHGLTKILHRFKSKSPKMRYGPTTTLGIAQNLFVALQNLRCSDESRVLWIDAICINQDDDEERSSEVLEMGSIYGNARLVIVWLGPSSHNSDLAIQTLKRISEGIIDDKERQTISYKPGSWAYTLQDDTEALKSQIDSWFAIKDLVTREWFSRLWVFQEICLAQEASLAISQKYLDWEIFAAGLEWLRMVATRLDRYFESLEISEVLEGNIQRFLYRGCRTTTLGISDAVDSTGNLHCSDPRDRLFAIRNLLHPSAASMIVPNYSLEADEVYTNFTKEWLRQFDDVNFLIFCTLPIVQSPTSSNLHLPSWVPNWSCASNSSDGLAPCRCVGRSSGFWKLGDGNSLGVAGTLVGKISYVSRPAEVPTTDAAIRELCHSWMKLASENDLATEESRIEASFSEMIVGGFITHKRPSTVENNCSVDEVKAFLNGMDASHGDIVDEIVSVLIRSAIRGRSFFVTAVGIFGLGPESVQIGDIIAVILGCDYPIILRPDEILEMQNFRVVGPCYAPEIMLGEALLGPLPAGCGARLEEIEGIEYIMFTNEKIRTQQDPRMPLPPNWRYRYGDEEEIEAKALKDMKNQWFENVETGEETWKDPRLTPELLRARGVAIKDIILV